jgi:hypothetical protein
MSDFVRRRLAALAVFATGCATPRAAAPRAGPPGPPALPSPRGVEIALFVRDTTEKSLTLAALLSSELERRGVRSRLKLARAEPTPPWPVDAALARAGGAPFTVRVSVVTRYVERQTVRRPEASSQRAAGFVVGPAADRPPSGFSHLAEPGGREPLDVGRSELQEDLRLEVMASLRSTDRDRPLAEWNEVEGALRRLQVRMDTGERDPWPAVYGALATRLATEIAAAIPPR